MDHPQHTTVTALPQPRRRISRDNGTGSRPRKQLPLASHVPEKMDVSGGRPKKQPMMLALSPRKNESTSNIRPAANKDPPSACRAREKDPVSSDRPRINLPNARFRPSAKKVSSDTNLNKRGKNSEQPKANTPSREPETAQAHLRRMPSSGCGGGAKDPNDLLMELCGKSLINYNWYHGLMPRHEVESLLEKDGDFIVRRTTLKKSSLYCITVMHGEPRHFPLQYKDGSWTLCGVGALLLLFRFPQIPDVRRHFAGIDRYPAEVEIRPDKQGRVEEADPPAGILPPPRIHNHGE